jgi:hypothetical protein
VPPDGPKAERADDVPLAVEEGLPRASSADEVAAKSFGPREGQAVDADA